MAHAWTYRKGRSECIRCGATADDTRGLPHGHYAVNGAAMTAQKIAQAFACPKCLADINPRVVDGKLRILCAGDDAHDIEAMGHAITKGRRDYIVAKQTQDYYTVLDGLPEELRKEIKGCR